MTVDLTEAKTRATALLERTHYFADLGITEPVADARMCARYVVDLARELEEERSARVAIQAARDRCVEIITRRGYQQLVESL